MVSFALLKYACQAQSNEDLLNVAAATDVVGSGLLRIIEASLNNEYFRLQTAYTRLFHRGLTRETRSARCSTRSTLQSTCATSLPKPLRKDDFKEDFFNLVSFSILSREAAMFMGDANEGARSSTSGAPAYEPTHRRKVEFDNLYNQSLSWNEILVRKDLIDAANRILEKTLHPDADLVRKGPKLTLTLSTMMMMT